MEYLGSWPKGILDPDEALGLLNALGVVQDSRNLTTEEQTAKEKLEAAMAAEVDHELA